MTLFTKCPVCKKDRLYIAKRKYMDSAVSPMPIESDMEICSSCFRDVKFVTLKQWSLQHYWKYRGIIIAYHWNQVKELLTKPFKNDIK